MSKKIEFFVIHVTDTPAGRKTTSDEIRQWHLGPFHKSPTEIIYKGVTYPSVQALPDEKVGGVSIKKITGRGWKQVGYRDMIHLDGTKENLVRYNYDAIVDAWEVTNGVAGINSTAMHIVIVGGKGKDTRTPEQTTTLAAEMKKALINWPWIKFAGHNQFDMKICPSFDVRVFCRSIGIPEKNIYQAPPKMLP